MAFDASVDAPAKGLGPAAGDMQIVANHARLVIRLTQAIPIFFRIAHGANQAARTGRLTDRDIDARYCRAARGVVVLNEADL